MANKELNRLKVVFAEKKKTNKWLGEQLGKDKTTISKWCTNTCQPDLGNLMKIAKLLEVEWLCIDRLLGDWSNAS